MTAVTIAIVSWNTRDLLDACLASMRADAQAGLAEVWVVDNGSTDGSVEMARERHPWAQVLVAERNLGYGPAANRVAEQTRTPWVAPSNADVELTPGALAALLAAAERDPGAGVLGPRLILPDGSTQPGVQPFPRAGDSLLRNTAAYRLRRRWGERLCLQGYWDPGRAARVDWVTGAFLLVRREAWDQIGGFDQGQWMYAEDLDLCWRATEAGWGVRYEPAAQVRHHLSVATAQAFGATEQRAARMMAATYRWMLERRGRAAAGALAAAEIGTLGARAVALAALHPAAPERWERPRAQARRDLRRQLAGVRAVLGRA